MFRPLLVGKYSPVRTTLRTTFVLTMVSLAATLGSAALRADGAEVDSSSSVKKLKQLSLDELFDIEVTSVSKRSEKLLETPSAIQVVTGEDIRRSGATSIPEALRLAGNLNIAQQNSHDWNISARGFNTDLGNKLLVMIDGRTVYTPLFSGVFWDMQDYLLEDIDRIEVISGPGGTLWGANAVNGVINVTTKSAKDTQGVFIEGGGGNELHDFSGVRYGGTLAPGLYYRVYGKYFERGDGPYSDGSDADNSWRMGQGGFRIDSERHPGNTLTFQGDFYSGDEHQETGGVSEVSGENLLGRWAHSISDDSHTSLQVYYDRTHLALPKASNGFAGAGILRDDLDTVDLDFQHGFRWATRNQIIWGLGYRFTHDVVENPPSLAFFPERLDHTLASGFVQDQITFRDDLFVTLGTKLEHNDYTGFETEPSVRLQWNFTSKQILWTAISRAVRTPSRIDRDLTEPTNLPLPFPQSILNGGADFDSESVIAYEVGHRAQLGDQGTLSVAAFYNDYRDVRSTTPGPQGFPSFGFPLVFANNLEGETYGVEMNATYQLLEGWRLQGTYNFLKEHLRVKPGQVDFSNGLNETADPEHQFSVRSSLDLPHDVQLDTGLRWVDILHNNNGPTPGTVPSYFELDFRIGWHPTERFELALAGQNLLHDHHPEYGFPTPTREEVERSFYGKVTWRY